MAKRHILIVDDMSSIRIAMSTLLKQNGYEPVQASSAQGALEVLRRQPIHLVLSDWNMPGMNGTDFVRALREDFPMMPVVMVTAESDRNRILELRELGVLGYLLKPFKPESLLAMMLKILPAR